jgi:hypothetical protein
MSIFSDYVDTYSDLEQAYYDSGTSDFESYVDSYEDLLNAYISSGTPDYKAYVQSHSDLENYWAANIRPQGISRVDWGQSHWNSNGQAEGRNLPRAYSQTKEEWGEQHWNSYGQRENREIPTNYPQTKEEWGATHWNEYGKNEARLLPGADQFTVQPNGTITVNTNTIGAQAHSKFQNFANQYNNSDGTNFKQIANALNNLGSEEAEILSNTGVVQNLVNTYYGKVSKWDPTSNKAYQPPMGAFDPTYYMTTGQGQEAFNAAQLKGLPSRFLYFPDENHWVTKPQNSILWQRVFFEWLDYQLN